MAIAFVNSAFSTASTTAGTTKTISLSVTAGNTIIVWGFGVNVVVSNVTDNAGNVYRARVSPVKNGSVATATCWSTDPNAALTTATITITVTFASSTRNTCVAAQYSGVTGIGKAVTASGSSATASVSLTVQNANNFVVTGLSVESTSTWASATGTLENSQAGAGSTTPGGALVDNTSASAGTSVTTSATITSGAWVASALELTTVSVRTDSNVLDWPTSVPCRGATVAARDLQSTAPSLSFSSQGVAAQLVTDEDEWENLIAPVQASVYQLLPYNFDDAPVVPVAASTVPSESDWQPPQPVQLVLQYPAPWQFQPDDDVTHIDEDYWQNAVAPTQLSFAGFISFDQSELDFATVEEEYWQSATAPIQLTLQYPAPWQFEQNEDTAQIEEDYWQNRVSPVQLSFAGFLSTDQADLDFVTSEEDYWQNRATPVQLTLSYPAPWQFEQYDPSTLNGQPDEDYWQNSVATIQLTLAYPSPWQFEQHDPSTLSGQLDEDYWQNATAPVQLTFSYTSPWQFEQNEDTPQTNEDYWQNSVAPVQLTFGSLLNFDQGDLDFVTLEEELWQNNVASVQLNFAYTAPWQFQQDDTAASSLQVDSDYWINTVQPVQLQFGSQPVSDQGDLDFVTVGEDFWQNGVAPVQLTLAYLAPWSSEQNEPAGSLRTEPDEDFWQNGTAPVQLTLAYPAPWQFEQHETFVTAKQVDDDYWQNSIKAVPLAMQAPSPHQFEQHEQAGGLYGVLDEATWVPNVTVGNTFTAFRPWVYDVELIAAPAVDDGDRAALQPVQSTFTAFRPWTPDSDSVGAPAADEGGLTALPPQQNTFLVSSNLWADDGNTLKVTVDEDYWQCASTYASTSFVYTQPWQGDQAETVSQVEEEYFVNWTTPTQLTFTTFAAWQADQSELNLSFLVDDEWPSWLKLTTAAVNRQLPQWEPGAAYEPPPPPPASFVTWITGGFA